MVPAPPEELFCKDEPPLAAEVRAAAEAEEMEAERTEATEREDRDATEAEETEEREERDEARVAGGAVSVRRGKRVRGVSQAAAKR